MIVVNLIGRIGNQLFIYAIAEAIRQRRGRNEKIVFYDKEILDCKWKNSLEDYDLLHVEYHHDYSNCDRLTRYKMSILHRFYKKVGNGDFQKRYRYEMLFQPLLNIFGIVSCIDGYTRVITPWTKHVYINGYFQVEKYFHDISRQVKQAFTYRLPILRNKDYVQQLESRNSICISVKVEHNADNPRGYVCDQSYYIRAIDYIIKHVENPLFFICSDNVPYVLEHLIDVSQYDYICQESDIPVSDSLAIMSTCKHFIINNTSYGWWAQYLSSREDKIVVAPNQWFTDENHPAQLFDSKWYLIDVSERITLNKKLISKEVNDECK